MNISEITAVVGLVIGSSTMVGGAGKYYLDKEYVAQNDLQEQFLKKDLKDLQREKRKLERLEPALRTPQQNWELNDIESDIYEIREELDDLDQG
jgi:hypothetical protein